MADKTKVAHVGSDSLDHCDRWHMDSVMDWLIKRNEHECLYYVNRSDDFIDLNEGRDFLAENHKYDIVILHMIYSPPDPISNSYRFGPGASSPFQTSMRHTKKEWRQRLISTGAKYFFTFGEYDEVSGEYLGSIDGYEGPIEAKDMFQVYLLNPQ